MSDKMSTKNSIKVAIKVRPMLSRDKDVCYWRVKENTIQLVEGQTEPYVFDHIFDQNSSNDVVFQTLAMPIVHESINGFNGTIFAYGQTSSGKTYTMMGDNSNPGVTVLAAKEIFKEIARNSDRQFLLRVGYIEIYNEKMYDLLNKKNADLKIYETPTGVNVNCTEIVITSEKDLLNCLCEGNKERTVGETHMNERSSRSHAIFRITIESRKMDRSDEAVTQSVLNLVDLAGSERADQTGATGARLKEGGHINKSLLFLSNVIKRLSENEDDSFVSYRDSKLTRILQASLGGNALTSIICTIKPTTIDETQSTLNFALRAKNIKNKPQVNEIVSDSTMMKRLEREIKELKKRLEEERSKNDCKIKVGLLENNLRQEVYKFITANSLKSIHQQQEKRRRTWCSTNSATDTASANIETALPSSAFTSRIPSVMTPLITMRSVDEPMIKSALPKVPEIVNSQEELFVPGETCTFDISPVKSVTPELTEQRMRTLSLTPIGTVCLKDNLERTENALQELQEFTNLEKEIDVHHDTVSSIKMQLDSLTIRNAYLEKERLDYIPVKIELLNTQKQLKNAEKCSNELQCEINRLKDVNDLNNLEINKRDNEIQKLKATNATLQLDNQNLVGLDVEFESFRQKSKQREKELLELLNEKDYQLQKLSSEINEMRAQRDYRNRNSAIDAQKELCLKNEISEANEKLLDMQTKYMALETKWQQQETVIRDLQQEYNEIQLKYDQLQANYNQLELCSDENFVQCEKLQKVNEDLQQEIEQLKFKLEQVQTKLLESADLADKASEEKIQQIKCLKQQLEQLQQKYKDLQEECDDLSTQLMESLSESETLRAQLEKELGKPRQANADFGSCSNVSTKSSGVSSVADTDDTLNVAQSFAELLTTVQELEIEHKNQTLLFMLKNQQNQQTNKLACRKLLLRNMQNFNHMQDANADVEGCFLQGNIKQLDFMVMDISAKESVERLEDIVQELKLQVLDLESRNEKLNAQNEFLVESTQRAISEMREQMACLTKEFEKTMTMETLEKGHAEMSMVCEELQDKLHRRSSIFSAEQSKIIDSMLNETIEMDEKALKMRINQLETELMAARKNIEQFELNIKILEEGKNQVENQNKEQQLNLLQKLEQSEQICRDNMRKCNDQWQQDKVQYIERIKELEQELKDVYTANHSELSEKEVLQHKLECTEKMLNQSSAEISELKVQLQDTQLKIKHLIEAKHITESELKAKTEQLLKLEEELSQVTKSVEAEKEIRQKLQNSLIEKEKIVLDLKNKSDEKESIALQLKDKSEELDKLKETLNERYKIEEELKTKIAELVEIKENVNENQNVVDGAIELLIDIATESNTHSNLAQAEEEVEVVLNLKTKCSELECNEAELRKQIENIELELRNKNTQLDQMNKLEEEKTYYELQFKKTTEKLNKIVQEKMNFESELLEMTTELNNLKNSLCDNEKDAADFRKVFESLKHEFSIKNSEYKELQIELKKYQDIELKLKEQIAEVEEEAAELRKTLECVKQECSIQNSEYKQLEIELNKYVDIELSLKAKIAEVEEDAAESRKTLECLKNEFSIQNSDDKELQVKLKKLKEQIADFKQLKENLKLKEKFEFEFQKNKLELEEMQKNFIELQKEYQINAELLQEAKATRLKLKNKTDELLEIKKVLNQTETELKQMKLLLKEKEQENQIILKESREIAVSLDKNNTGLKNLQEEFNETKKLCNKMTELSKEKESLAEELFKKIEQINLLEKRSKENEELYEKLKNELTAEKKSHLSEQQKLAKDLNNKNVELENLMQKLKEVEQDKDKTLLNLKSAEQIKVELEQKYDIILQEKHIWLSEKKQFSLVNKENETQELLDKIEILQQEIQSIRKEIQLSQKEKQDCMEQLEKTTQELHSTKLQTSELQNVLSEYENLNRSFLTLEIQNKTLQIKENELKKTNSSLQIQLNNLQEENSKLNEKLNAQMQLTNKVQKEHENLLKECKDLRSKHDALRELNTCFKQNLETEQRLRKELEQRSEIHVADVERNKKLQEQLRSQLASQNVDFKLERGKLEETISCLLQEKKVLEKRLFDLDLQLKNVTKDIDSVSLEADSLFCGSPTHQQRKSGGSSDGSMDSRTIKEKTALERKNRRLSTHDDNRRLNTHDDIACQITWKTTRDVGSMTNPLELQCSCAELQQKLTECEKNLFISESQVCAMQMALRNHPLKDENAKLLKRLKEEQDKHRSEIKRLKEVIVENTTKSTQYQHVAAKSVIKTSSIETQTDGELDVIIQQLNAKYIDLKDICRGRLKRIKLLESEIAQKENVGNTVTDDSKLSSYEAGQMQALKKQCKLLQEELAEVQSKYTDAKLVLNMRRIEIERLKNQLEQIKAA